MKRKTLVFACFLALYCLGPAAWVAADATPEATLSLWYLRPAGRWLEALPIGNGRLGGMIFRNVRNERIQLNEDTLWSGAPTQWNNPEARKLLFEMRRLIFDGRYAEAHELGSKMMGPYNQSYLPMGNLHLSFDHPDHCADYRRILNLDTAIASVRYKVGEVNYSRECFASHPDQILVVRLSAGRAGHAEFHGDPGQPSAFQNGCPGKCTGFEGQGADACGSQLLQAR